MGIFKRDQRKDVVDKEESSEVKLVNKRVRKPAREKLSEEKEIKIWTKHERYFVLGVLVLTILISGVMAIASRSWKLPNVPRLSLPEDAFQETFVLEKKVKEDSASELIEKFKSETNNLSGVYGFKVVDLKSGESYGLLETEEFQAASLIKLPLMSFVFEESEQNKLNLESVHTLKESDKIGGSGSLQYADEGEILEVKYLVELMGKNSDNTAFNIMVNKLGKSDFQEYIDEIGMTATSYETNMTTINDVALFFRKLWENRLVNADNKLRILDYLTDTIYESHLPKGAPEGVDVAHKYGSELHVINDAGIFLTDKPFVVVIMSKGVVEKEANKIIPELSKLIFEFQSSR